MTVVNHKVHGQGILVGVAYTVPKLWIQFGFGRVEVHVEDCEEQDWYKLLFAFNNDKEYYEVSDRERGVAKLHYSNIHYGK